jgi:hypothetical protein
LIWTDVCTVEVIYSVTIGRHRLRNYPMFRFTIRDVLWLMVVVALGVGWWMQRQDALALAAANKVQAEQNKDLAQRLENAE